MALPALRRVLVTGGNKGIGRALCQQLVAIHGFHVLLGSRDPGRGEEAVRAILEKSPKECADRLETLSLDVSDDASVRAAVEEVKQKYGAKSSLYGIVNNAGVGFDHSMQRTLDVNTYGAKRVCEAFLPLLQEDGRIVNTASASGPNYVSRASGDERQLLMDPEVTWEALDNFMKEAGAEPRGRQPYGLSKACLISYTMLMARLHPDLKINAMTPGYILTDITRGMGATKPPEEGLIGELEGNGRYYGSDALRSPIDRYRAPGDPPYEGP